MNILTIDSEKASPAVLPAQVAKAFARQGAVDIAQVVDDARGKAPDELASAQQKSERLQFIRQQELAPGDTPLRVYERIISGNEIQDVNYLARGARVAQAICRITIVDGVGRRSGWGTGFLVAPGVLITNNHVLPDASMAARSYAEFSYELDINGVPQAAHRFELQPGRLFFTSKGLDFSVVAIAPRSEGGDATLQAFGFLPLVGVTGKVADGEWLTIVQHPGGSRKQLCVRENKLVKRTDDVLWYSTDTLGGSSGSPVFNNEWYVVALHHSGIPVMRDGKPQTRDGRDYDPARDDETAIHWIANEGIRVSRIVDTLAKNLGTHPLIRPIVEAAPEYANLHFEQYAPRAAAVAPPARAVEQPRRTVVSTNPSHITVTLAVQPDGSVAVVGSRPGDANESALAALEKAAARKKTSEFEVPFNAKYDDRGGFDTKFLSATHEVDLPTLSPALRAVAEPLIADKTRNVLDYHNYSLVQHGTRRFAIYTAANVDCSSRWDMARPTDTWRIDPRIRQEAQIGEFYYRANNFDRGHLTRREDLEFGKTFRQALVSAADTCHFTNCTPQHSRFNQNKELWQGIERHLLEDAIFEDQFRAQVFTGPILEEDDPVYEKYPKIQYPVRFWKVVAAVNADKKLFATAYILDQAEVIDRYGIEAAPEVPFREYKTFQVPIAEVERLTGLSFTANGNKDALSKFDPLATRKPRRSRRVSPFEAAGLAEDFPSGYVVLDDLSAIVKS